MPGDWGDPEGLHRVPRPHQRQEAAEGAGHEHAGGALHGGAGARRVRPREAEERGG